MTLDTSASQAGGVHRYVKRVTFPNQYALYHCTGIVNGTGGGNWLNCGGLFRINPKSGTEEQVEPYTKIEAIAYCVSTTPSSNQTNTNIYICGEKNN